MPTIPETVEQYPAHELTQTQWDVIVIGAGPAGSIAAAHLAEKGVQTLLLDKEIFPRSKVCGDGLNHDSLRFLEKIGLLETVQSAGHQVEKACAFSTGGIQLDIPGPYLCLERRFLDSILVQRAVLAGATFCSGKVDRLSFPDNKIREIRVRGSERPFLCRFVILATGAGIHLARSLHVVDSPFPSAMAARCYVRSKERIDSMIGSFVRPVLPGYGWIFPLGDGLFNMGVIAYYTKGRNTGLSLRNRFHGFTQDFPLARKVLEKGHVVSELRAAPLRCGLPSPVAAGKGNLLAAGETIGTTLHFTGEGIGKAMETGELAAQVIHKTLAGQNQSAGRLFSEELETRFRPKYMGYHRAQWWVGHPWLNDFMARRGMKSKYLQKAVLDAIIKEDDPGKAFSLSGLIRSFWR